MNDDCKWDDRFKCYVVSLDYQFAEKLGKLYMASGDCCDMAGCLAVFQAIDPEVLEIQTYSGGKADTSYLKGCQGWESYAPSQ